MRQMPPPPPPVRGDKNLERTAIEQFMEQPFVQGWDPDFGGLFYFLDCEGGSPVQLEWPLKLWWVHCEALLAFLLAYRSSREARHWARFKQLWRYCRKVGAYGTAPLMHRLH